MILAIPYPIDPVADNRIGLHKTTADSRKATHFSAGRRLFVQSGILPLDSVTGVTLLASRPAGPVHD